MGRAKRKKADLTASAPPLVVHLRSEWGASPPTSTTPLPHPIKHIVFDHTLTGQCDTHEQCAPILQQLQKKHTDEKGLPDIVFNWMVGGGGHVYEGRGWHNATINEQPWATEYSGKSVNIAFIGTFSKEIPPQQIVTTAGNLLKTAFDQNMLDPDFGIVPMRLEESAMKKLQSEDEGEGYEKEGTKGKADKGEKSNVGSSKKEQQHDDVHDDKPEEDLQEPIYEENEAKYNMRNIPKVFHDDEMNRKFFFNKTIAEEKALDREFQEFLRNKEKLSKL